MEYVFVATGLVCLFLGGDWLVKGAIALSAKLGLPTFLISLTVVGFGTSMPELLVSVRAAFANAPGIALGNVVGSNIANILLIIGLAAVIAPMSSTSRSSKRDLVVMLAATAMLAMMLYVGTIGFGFGIVMVVLLALYLAFAYVQDCAIGAGEIEEGLAHITPVRVGLLLVSGMGLLAIGADLLVRGATVVAADLGVSNAIIGLTVVAVGTSLPELATSIAAALKRQSDIAIGNVIGSNIFNILGILGLTALISPIPVAERFIVIDGWTMLATTAILVALLLLGRGIGRIMGALFLVLYAGYMITMA
ncbi:calcium/sodium antiporter [Cohaesibacter celericrescens]|jgi:cation:H+ antiporter|uniref:calcium/sodium antiporter n=1 Tax=Cohaesibacter celericrescens TaxID=2067669 RepID=UPI00356148D1